MKKLLSGALAVLGGSQAKAAVVTGSATAAIASVSQADPWPWVISAAGALIVTVKFPSAGRVHGWVNVLISVLAGGLSCTFVASYVERFSGIDPGNYLVAFVVSALWPAVVNSIKDLWPAIRARVEKKIGEQP